MANRFIKVVDDFFPDFDLIRSLIDGVEFGDCELNGKMYTGFSDTTLPIKALLKEHVGGNVKLVMSHLRMGNSKTPLTHYIHADNAGASFAAVVHLNAPACDTGTAFWRHKESGKDRLVLPCPLDEFQMFDKDIEDESKWGRLEYVQSKLNRAVIFDSSLFHSRYPKNLPIQDHETPRLVSTIFFNVE